LNEHNRVFARSGPQYATGISLGPSESSTQTATRSLQPFLQGSLGDRPTIRPTDHAIRFLTISGAHSAEAKFCYCLRLQQVFIGAVDSTNWINFNNQQLYSAVRVDMLQGMWRHTTNLQYYLEESVSHQRTRQVTQLFTYLLTHKLFSSCIRRYLVSRACDLVMPALSAVLLTISFQFSLLFRTMTKFRVILLDDLTVI